METKLESMQREERIKTTELREVKKRLNSLVNRRSAVISARFEGPKQDPRLGDTCREHDDIDAEILRITNLKKKQDKMGKKSNLNSSLVDGGNAMSPEKLLQSLEKMLLATKEKVRGQLFVWPWTLLLFVLYEAKNIAMPYKQPYMSNLLMYACDSDVDEKAETSYSL